MLRNIRLILAYDGTNYVGWQVQPNGLSVQAVVMRALKKLMGHDVNLLCAGRTDAGVHAFGQVASFQTETPIPCDGIRKALRRFLPDDVIVHHVDEVPIELLEDTSDSDYDDALSPADVRMRVGDGDEGDGKVGRRGRGLNVIT